VKELEGTLEGKAARAYLEDRGLDKDVLARFGIGYAPSGGDLLLRHLKSKYAEKLLAESGLIRATRAGGSSTGSGGALRFQFRMSPEKSSRLGAARWATTSRST